MDDYSELIVNCDKHGVNPFHYICAHLAMGSSDDWIEVDTGDNREVACDYACAACKAKEEAGSDDIKLVVACAACVRDLVGVPDGEA